jgi:cytochrome bd ubiquinol oxidase subunit I
MNELQAQCQKEYGPGNYIPNVFIQYWSMRLMAYIAVLVMLFALWGGWLLYKHRLDRARWFLRVAPWAVILPFVMNTAGWMLTENGRQPWIVQGLMKTANGVSPSVSATDIWISLVAFYALFIAFGIADAWLMIRYGRKELDHDPIARLVSHTDGDPDSRSTDEHEHELVY